MASILEADEESTAKIQGIVRSYPEGISPEEIEEGFGYKNNIRAALLILEERGEAKRIGHARYVSKIYR